MRSVAVDGGTKFATEPLLEFLELKGGEYFNQSESNKDVTTLIDLYGSQGHVFADVQADLRFLEEPGQLDVVYRIKEGDVFKVSEINVHIARRVSAHQAERRAQPPVAAAGRRHR